MPTPHYFGPGYFGPGYFGPGYFAGGGTTTTGFSTVGISDPKIAWADAEIYLTWTSTLPPGTWYQVYVNRELAWYGTTTNARIPWQVGTAQIDIGTVGSDEVILDFSSSLTSGYSNRAQLTWEGGAHLSGGLDHFAIYSGTAPGGAISYARPIDTVPAYDAGIPMDGYGMGGFGRGGWGHAASSYSWRSGVLAGGVWNFAVVPVDVAGNPDGSPATTSVTIVAPPRPPAPDANGLRLHCTLNPTTLVPTLTWSASP